MEISDELCPQAAVIALVRGNLNTHSPATLHETFEPEEASRLTERFELRYTPRQGSRLDMAETELGMLGRQCLSGRIDNMDDLRREAKVWQAASKAAGTDADSQFTTEEARIKLARLHPPIEA